MGNSGSDSVTIKEVDELGNVDDRSKNNEPGRNPGSVPAGANPFIIGAWILAAGLLLSGVMMLIQSRYPSAAGNVGSGNIPLSLILLNVAPYALLAGVLTVAALMFWHASQWQHRYTH